MPYEVTVGEASARLGIGKARIYQLIENGSLVAEKVGGIWLIDSRSVEARASSRPKAGRPAKDAYDSETVCAYTLMNRTHEILTFRYDEAKGAFSGAEAVIDADRAPLGMVSPRGATASTKALEYWWKHRSIPATRRGVDAKLAQLGVEWAFQIPFRSLGLSLSDQYWVRPIGVDIEWSDVNYFENDFAELSADSGWLAEVGLDSPDNTSEGELPKKWICDQGKRLLLKGGSALNQEPYNEVVATLLYRRLLDESEYVAYELRDSARGALCVCEDFVLSSEEYIPAYYVRQIARQANHHSDYQHYIECCARLGIANAELALAKMIVCDDILGNCDRHWRNFGLVRDVETLEYRIAPLFDSGSSLWCAATEGALRSHDFQFETKPFYQDANRQLRLVNDYSWFDPGALEGFVGEVESVLAANSALASRIDPICCAVQGRIDRIVRML